MTRLRVIPADQVERARGSAVDPEALTSAASIVADVRDRGLPALREHAERLGDIQPGERLIVEQHELDQALAALDPADRAAIEQMASNVERFARAQRDCLTDLDTEVPAHSSAARAGHWVAPVDRAGCYAPAGRFPLPSSLVMTAVTAKAAGVPEVYVASPKPSPVMLATAAIVGVTGFIAAGGAQAIAALAYGADDIPPTDAVVGPGNKWVTAAKQLIAGHVAIDSLAGPSELIVLADDSADDGSHARLIAADLLAQAEHDTDAVPILVTTSKPLIERIEAELERQLETLPTRATAEAALRNGYTALARDLDEAIRAVHEIAPEHLEVMTADARSVAKRINHYGAVFIGPRSAEVLGDYGLGPNHVLPTGGTARSFAGLSVLTFLRARTWLEVSDPNPAIYTQAAHLARLEHLEAHARAAEARTEAHCNPGCGAGLQACSPEPRSGAIRE